jgi:hypothetical protein
MHQMTDQFCRTAHRDLAVCQVHFSCTSWYLKNIPESSPSGLQLVDRGITDPIMTGIITIPDTTTTIASTTIAPVTIAITIIETIIVDITDGIIGTTVIDRLENAISK